ncbi:MAG TPA: bifunctional 4-hydroxy-2-oxoglutarate aldolase/2-dehydro-3-deoxy-phosphogluconate aldolase [Candidatus Acidoferrales bacterium]|jgi:2-dehydro-3-deoxyphosphogluconate aldolase/(4S)-4-hydroxy-2-oxoglutarate aldolase|nr:bifunctional 4-hydroxy-2-oxoglutarate aldolase/2-dehydro-3-deoxy-phosphogluconate aldolase [Candidatus Acidoferrales bacterium]
MNHKHVRTRIQEIGIIPSVRVSSADDARFAAESLSQGGIPIAEIAMTVPGALRVISDLVKSAPEMIVGAGSVLDAQTARRCIDAGVKFLTTDGLIMEIVECATMQDVVVFPGALTPTEVIAAWRAGSDFVKVVPCAAVGGEKYVRSLKAALAQIPLIAAGGVNQQTAIGYLSAGAAALGIGEALIPWEAVALRQSGRIRELARRFLNSVEIARRENGTRIEEVVVHRASVLAFKEA